ncbi:trypsin-like peptidase domain-containing protein [Roseibium sp.]|uniref:trypsin-like peptidase domain-containing protein n=1 Tax=Roseibium sp. TaxID=1936156 RepID=UPI003A9868B5
MTKPSGRGGAMKAICIAVVSALFVVRPSAPVHAEGLKPIVLDSVVSVLPVWPGKPQGGGGTPAGAAPEGSGIAVLDGRFIATAYHVIEPAERIDIRLADGRILPARLAGADVASDIALLAIDQTLPVLETAPEPMLAGRACIVSNAYGLDLSVTCGIVSALHVANAGFNPVEDFVQTDAAANPGSSGGALVDGEGRLIGMVSAIFASKGETNIGVNFAVSSALLRRVVVDLADDGAVTYVSAGWGLEMPSRESLRKAAGARIASLAEEGAASEAGLSTDDVVTSVNGRRIKGPRDVISALALVLPGQEVPVTVLRGGNTVEAALSFPVTAAKTPAEAGSRSNVGTADCPYPQAVCATRQAVFPLESFATVASGVRIARDLIVTGRHAVADRTTATVFTPAGPLKGEVIPSVYAGDLALIKVEGLPEDGEILSPDLIGDRTDMLQVVGADVAQRQVRVFQPGQMILTPADGAELGRLHVTSYMQPGVSGGALVDQEGRLVGIAAGGGAGYFEALPAGDIATLLAGRDNSEALATHGALGRALALCQEAVEDAESRPRGTVDTDLLERISDTCALAKNQGQLQMAGRVLGQAGDFSGAIALHEAAVAQVPNSLNARVSLLVSLQLAGRFEDMLPHARFMLEAAPENPQTLRFAIQSGVWGGDMDLAEAAYAAMEKSDPRQAQAARRFIDTPPPRPARRG